MFAEKIKELIGGEVKLEYPANLARGDYAFFARGQAEEIAERINKNKPDWLEKVEAVNGFVNFYLSSQALAKNLKKIAEERDRYGWSEERKGEKAIFEYTDPNPFKEFHIGHLMSNTVGEALSRLAESGGGEVKRACYQGDVGMHVAKAVWGYLQGETNWAKAYAKGAAAFESSEESKKEIQDLNRKIYERSDEKINKIYDEGRAKSLEYFDQIYKRLGTKFDYFFFESETGKFGRQIVEENIGNIFEKSDGAVVFRGEQFDLHTRVFINSEGLPTYEAKELGLAKIKHDKYPYDLSVVITGNEVNAYFQVLLKVMSLIFPDLATKTKHFSHGMLRLPTGKMSSRTGDVITAESLVQEILVKLGERGTEEIAVAALKFAVLKQAPGRDIIFDFDKSISFEGDSGPYLQYTAVRAKSVLEKASPERVFLGSSEAIPRSLENLPPAPVERWLCRFPEVVTRARETYSPQYLISYLLELAGAYNAYYAKNKIIGSADEGYRLALTAAVAQVLKNGLWLLGIQTPEKM